MPLPRRVSSGTFAALGATSLSLLVLGLLGCGDAAPIADPAAFDVARFRNPAAELGPHVRWWWPGGSVDDATIEAQVTRLADAGFAGIELQTLLFGLSPADIDADAQVRSVGDPAYLARVATFLRVAQARHLATTLTLGSGWPSGGAFSTDVRPRELVFVRVDVDGPTTLSMAVPNPATPDWVAASNALFPVVDTFDPDLTLVVALQLPVLDATATPPLLGVPVDVSASVSGGILTRSVPAGAHALFFVYEHAVDQLVAGAAFPGTASRAHVIDHLDPRGAGALLAEQSGPWLDALAPLVPDEVFVDSFEFVAELPWARPFATRFASETGYPVTDALPFLFRDGGEAKYVDILRGPGAAAFASPDGTGERAREDYEDVRALLFHEGFVEPLTEFTGQRGVALRMQGHGGYGHVLDSYARADVPESEGLFAGGTFDFLELAASAAHVAGRTIVSSESFVVINPSSSSLSPDELWMLAGRAYAAGINRLVFHGVAYPYTRSNGARWYPFRPDPASGVITAGPLPIASDVRPGEPEWASLPDFNRALARLSYAMTRGRDQTDVAWLLHEREIPDAASVRFGRLRAEQGESATSLALRRAGYTYDRVSPRMLSTSSAAGERLQVGAASYRALLLTEWPSAQPDELAAVRRALDAGIPVIVRGALPSRARGLREAVAHDAQVAVDVAAIAASAQLATRDEGIASALAATGVEPLLGIGPSDCGTVSSAHRELTNGHLFLLFNESASACTATLTVRVAGRRASLLDPRTGAHTRLRDATVVTVELASVHPMLLWIEE